MAIVEATTVAGLTTRGDIITARQLGMNLAQGYEQFGSLPWQKFDEVQAQIGSSLVRFPGGTEAETLFSYANPFATSAVGPTGQVFQVTAPDAFLTYAAQTGTKATFVLATAQLLTHGSYGTRDFDYSKVSQVQSYVTWLLDHAGPGGIATFELGNEYATFMNAVEYGKVASTLGLIVGQCIDNYYVNHPGTTAPRPDVAVQVWGVSAGEAFTLSDLTARNQTVMAQFSAAELSKITATTTHFYYSEGKFLGQPNAHTYGNIPTALAYSQAIMNTWEGATGRPLDTIFSEWNVNFKDPQSFGLKQVPILLEMFSSLVATGVDEMDMWSTLYNASSLADYKGSLQASGALMQIMAHEAVGMRVADVPVVSPNYDIHGFTNGAKTLLFISSMADGTINLNMNLGNYLDRYALASARVIGVNAAGADGVYKTYSGLHPWEEPDAPVTVTAQNIGALLSNGVYNAQLGAHETLVLSLNLAPIRFGTMAPDTMNGLGLGNDRIDAMASNDKVYGFGGNDTLFGGDGNDMVWGGDGNDRDWGGTGNDTLWGGTGNDTIEGRTGSDAVAGDDGNDYLSGGDGSDALWGGLGADAFVFRAGETGTDVVVDFRSWEQDFFVYEGNSAVSAADFSLERRAIAGAGGAGAELLVHWHGAAGPILAIMFDAGWMGSLTAQDGATGAMFTIY